MEDLKLYTDFESYLKALKRNLKSCIIVVAVRDALTPARINHDNIYKQLKDLGFGVDLSTSFRESYVGILFKGNVLFEKKADNTNTPVLYKDNKFKVVSKGFLCGNYCSICLNGDEYALNEVGLNIAVFDESLKNIDSVAVNLLREEISFIHYQKSAWEMKLYELKRFGIQPFTFFIPKVDDIRNKSEWEKLLIRERKSKGTTQGIVANNVDKYYELSGMNTCYDSIDEFKEHLKSPNRVIKGELYSKNVYHSGKYFNVDANGRRKVNDSPIDYEFTIHMFGDSVGLLWEVKDEDTAASQLQRLLNENKIKARVVNYCVPAMMLDNIINYITDTSIQKGDMVVVLCTGAKAKPIRDSSLRKNGITADYMIQMFHRPHNYGEVFYDANHFNHNGLKVVAEIMFNKINKFLQTRTCQPAVENAQHFLPAPKFSELSTWLAEIKRYRRKIGSIV